MRETFALAAVLLGACSLPPDAAPVDAPADVAIDAPPVPGGPHHGYVVSRLLVPANATEAAQLGLDIDDRPNDANGGIDNQLGMVLANLRALAPQLDLGGANDEQIARGGILMLVGLEADDLGTDSGAGLRVFLGEHPQPPPCADANDQVCRRHLTGAGTFDVRADSPDDPPLAGRILASAFRGGPGAATIQLALSPGGAVTVPLRRAKAELTGLSATAIGGGKLGGGILQSELDTRVYPALASSFRATFEADCPPPRTPPTCNCAAGTTGRTIQSIFDKTPTDCMITDAEVITFINGLVTPDLDLDGDGVAESVSIGLGVQAVAATFTPPP